MSQQILSRICPLTLNWLTGKPGPFQLLAMRTICAIKYNKMYRISRYSTKAPFRPNAIILCVYSMCMGGGDIPPEICFSALKVKERVGGK